MAEKVTDGADGACVKLREDRFAMPSLSVSAIDTIGCGDAYFALSAVACGPYYEREPETPVALVRLVDRMLAKDPAGRPTAAELVKELTAASTPDGLLTPSQRGRRRWKRRGIYLAIALAGAIPVIIIGVRILIGVMAFMMGGGEGADPALIASRGAVPDSIVRLAREAGIVGVNERVQLVFIQANHTFADALLITDSTIIRRTPRGIIRRSIEESDIDLKPIKGRSAAGGLLIVKRKGAPPDTLYEDLSGREGFRLINEFSTWQRAHKARDSTAAPAH